MTTTANRRLVRGQTCAPGPMTVAEAFADMALLGHEFYLFVERDTGRDHVVSNGEDLVLEAATAPRLAVVRAAERLDTGDEPFVFFVDAATGRGAVLHRRADGNHGLVSPH
ncbi:sigma 54 modulation/S30EA ribosomal C-terminal domain-containing protein [Allokutzneria sp. A3M-2-11 16]|uniref:sigma 54 modulation/S30EA ribosomal C-terminal domain-containing protein n=1 Tax=Allokutzneria sp. A3M-2-11 16 TaxID=2962043 RepID=UPI0020B7C5B3|nr:sigma 54 modulation/S30EA ribosomal C-terminal domain-containing protein [Allokutzneria sp. A3M-2-11 16]MCP3804483.1 sigma 54 modulation/S30EA ribosomal C-terminal domain-containing protein [Allokutzneria sp. A3M-2-11 16]